MSTMVLSIGSGIGRGPNRGRQQTAGQFADFEGAVREWLVGQRFDGVEVYVDGARSFGTDELGQFEASSTFVASFPQNRSRATVAAEVAELAEKHAQRCIAFTIGDTTFEGPGEE